jgi:DNA-binding transcriptional LysR family regulator
MELDSPEAIVSMVHARLGVSIVPDLAVKPFDAVPVMRIGLGPDAPVRTLGLVYRDDQVKKRVLDELFDALMHVIEISRK